MPIALSYNDSPHASRSSTFDPVAVTAIAGSGVSRGDECAVMGTRSWAQPDLASCTIILVGRQHKRVWGKNEFRRETTTRAQFRSNALRACRYNPANDFRLRIFADSHGSADRPKHRGSCSV